MITLADIEMYGKCERHSFEGDTFIGVKIDLSADKWALLEINTEEKELSWKLFEKNWTLAKKPYSGQCSEGDVCMMHDGCYPMGIGTELAKANLWAYCDDAERGVLLMNGLFHMLFIPPKD
jgi:hypothetical protein